MGGLRIRTLSGVHVSFGTKLYLGAMNSDQPDFSFAEGPVQICLFLKARDPGIGDWSYELWNQ